MRASAVSDLSSALGLSESTVLRVLLRNKRVVRTVYARATRNQARR